MTPRALAEQDRPPVGVFTDPGISADVINRVRRTSRDWLVDVLGFLLCVGFVTITLVDGIERDLPPGPTAVDVALGGLASLGFWLRRRWPVGFAVTVGLLSLYSVSASGVALLALFFVAVHRRPAVAGLTAAGYALASVLSVLVRPDVAPPNWPQGVLGVACVAAVLAWGMLVRARRQLARSRREQAAFEQELRVAEARRLERTRIAREMHDVLAHRLSLLSLQAGALELWPDAPDEFAKAAGVIRDSAHRALEDLRDVLGVLRAGRADGDRPVELPDPPQPSLADLQVLVDEARLAGVPVALDCRLSELTSVPETIGRTAYRIVQEGLTNVRKHGNRDEASVAVHGTAGRGLTVEIRNPCPVGAAGAWTIPGSGTGIIGLAERTSIIGGRLEHGCSTDGDFRLWAWLPWPL